MKEVKTAIQNWYNAQPIGAATNGCFHREVPRRLNNAPVNRPYTIFDLRHRPEETMTSGVDYEWINITFTIWSKGKSAEESDDLYQLLIDAFDNEPPLNVLGFQQVRLDRQDSEQYQDPDAGRAGGWLYDVAYTLKLKRL